MNKKILVSIFIIIAISLIALSFNESEIITEEKTSEIIREKYEEIEKNKMINEQLTNPYYPKEREWIQSGPFMIDRSEYLIGEKIFINIVDLDKSEKGKIAFFKIINNTHVFGYKTINFDGEIKQNSNLYIAIELDERIGLCTAEQLVGNWRMLFTGVDVKDLEFKIIDRIIPGIEDQFQPVC